MAVQDYRQTLTDAVQLLNEVEINIFTAMVNVGFSGEYSDISRLHETGEVLNLELAMFENTKDVNLDILVKLIKDIAQAKNKMISINKLDIEFDD